MEQKLMTYDPEYSTGEILVCFRKNVDGGFADNFGEIIGYKLSYEKQFTKGTFVYLTNEGNEEEAIQRFMEHSPRIVDWASRRDLRLERRWQGLDELANRVADLQDEAELPHKQYQERLRSIADYVAKLHDSE
jgi:hypothetical protein